MKTEDIRAYRRRYYRQHKKKILKRVSAWQKKNIRVVLARQKKREPDVKLNIILKTMYGISVHDYRYLLQKQRHKCAICKKWDRWRRLDVDHDHKTGHVRGLLCNKCNTALGSFQTSVVILERAIAYVKAKPVL